ncbi:MAG: cytochrome C [Alphaproteobacteria bacterium]|nr:cytochrome C [Alphaproteobacteria bacterium]
MTSTTNRKFIKLYTVAAVAAIAATPAHAVPAFAVKTGQPCSACHVGGFGPQLTPFGRAFKMGGYTMDAGTDAFPISAMAEASFVHTEKDQASPPADHYSVNDNTSLDQASLFLAGGYGDHVGVFSQWTYDGIGRSFSWDNLDFRVVDRATLAGSDVQFGLSINNNPGVEDAWNTLPAWGYPYAASAMAPAPAAGTIFDGGLAQSVLGATAYAWIDQSIYAEAGMYWTPSSGFLSAMGTDFGPGPISGVAPYVRVAYQKDFGDQNFEIGGFGFFPALHPGGDTTTPNTDSYSDVGIDGSYQFMGDGSNIYTVNARYTNEHQHLGASQVLGLSTNTSDTLEDFRVDGSYYWHNLIGATVQWFDTWGSADTTLYGGNSTFKPDSSGVMFQIDGTPWGNDPPFGRFGMRVGLQYTMYSKFDGASTNYDGLGHNASDNNTLRIFTWFAL